MRRAIVNNFSIGRTGISKMILIVTVVVIIIAVAGIAYYLSTQPGGEVSPTPTPSPTQTSTASPAPTVSPATGISGASSLKYSVSLTENGVLQGTTTYQGKNIGANNFMLRIEYTDSDGDQILIFNGAERKAWSYSDGEWSDISAAYDAQFSVWNNLWQSYNTNLAGWAGLGEYSYTHEGSTVRIFDIQVNAALDDSLFTHS